MTYERARLAAIREAGQMRINRLVEIYDKSAQTVILLPGGMGSELDRSPKKFTGTPMPVGSFKEVWIDFGIATGDGKKLEIETSGHDKGDFIIAPTRPFSFVIDPYEDLGAWARDAGHNYEVFAFDWRRSLGECAVHLKQFLLDFRAAIEPRYGIDPLKTTTLVCHSQGGLVAKLFLSREPALAADLAATVTVATPFYGTITHMRRYFMGEDLLNSSSANGGAANVARIIGTLPGPFVLMPLDRATWLRDGARIALPDYPVRDNKGVHLDPYDPVNLARFPGWMQGQGALFAAALAEMGEVRAKLPAALQRRLFHIRAVAEGSKTELEWKPLPPDFDPETSSSPLRQKGAAQGGDGTVAAWSAFLPDTPAENLATLPSADGHLGIMEHPETLAVLDRILDRAAGPMTSAALAAAPRLAPRRALRPAAGKPRAGKAELRRLYAAVGVAAAGGEDKAALLARLEKRKDLPDPVGERAWRGIAASLIGGRPVESN